MIYKGVPHMRVRLGSELMAQVQASAKKGHRSQTAEVRKRLEESFRQDDLREMIKEAVNEALASSSHRSPERAKVIDLAPFLSQRAANILRDGLELDSNEPISPTKVSELSHAEILRIPGCGTSAAFEIINALALHCGLSLWTREREAFGPQG